MYREGRCWDRGPGELTVDIESEIGCVAAHVADGSAAIDAAVTLVEEGEDEGALLGGLQRWITALFYPKVLLGAVEVEKLEVLRRT